MEEFSSFGPWAELALGSVAAAMRRVRDLAGRGTEVVGRRSGGYRAFDPEIIRADLAAEEAILDHLKHSGARAVALSEEAGRVRLEGDPERSFGGIEEGYVVIDPFDGSALYRRKLPAFWYSCIGLYGSDGEPRAAAVADLLAGTVDFCNDQASYTARLEGSALEASERLRPSEVTDLKEAYLSIFVMKPAYMYPTVVKYMPLLRSCQYLLANGGPASFSDVAHGRLDVYIGIKEAATEVFTGLPIALRAGCPVTTFDGNPIPFDDDINAIYAFVCSANERLHDQVLYHLARIK
jgi:fructose-1,6-bisphosphatase/inositol monophosphatase family enzyme